MASHYNYLSHLPLSDDGQKFAAAIALGCIILFLTKRASSRISNEAGIKSSLVPQSGLSLFSFFDIFVDSFVKYQDSILGKENRKYLPICGGVFVYVLFANLLGLIPGMPAITTTVWVTVGLALVAFFSFNYYGIKEHGVWGYLKHFAGPVWWLAALMFPLEILSTLLRILTLNLRLYWNITADHIVLGVFTEMTKVVVPVVFYGLGTFVCFMQAFIFSTLTMVYILLASQHEEGHDEAREH